jgi:hypothetical protein
MAGRPKTPKRGPRPLTDEDRAEILRRHQAGESRNSIARTMQRSGETVSKIVAQAGQSFARAADTRVATEVRTADLAARRTAFAVRLQDEAELELDRLRQPTEYFDWGGKDHDFDTHTTREPVASDRRAIMSTVAAAVDRSLKLVPPKDDPAEEARSMVGQLMAGLAQVYREQQPTGEGAGDDR